MNILLVYPEYPDTFWSFKHALKFVSKKAANPPLGLLTVASLLPVEWKKKLATLSDEKRREEVKRTRYLECPRSKIGMRRYKISCNNCGETLGYCWATDKTLNDRFYRMLLIHNGTYWCLLAKNF